LKSTCFIPLQTLSQKKKTADTADHSKEMLRKLIIIITVQTAPVSNQ